MWSFSVRRRLARNQPEMRHISAADLFDALEKICINDDLVQALFIGAVGNRAFRIALSDTRIERFLTNNRASRRAEGYFRGAPARALYVMLREYPERKHTTLPLLEALLWSIGEPCNPDGSTPKKKNS